MSTFSALTQSKKFSKNEIDTPLPAPTPIFTVGGAAATVIYDLECLTDYAFPTINLRVNYTELHADVDTPLSSLIRQVTIKGTGIDEPLVIDGPSLQYLPVAACALLTRLGEMPNFNSLYVDPGFKAGTESEAYLAIPAILRPGKYQFEIQYSGYAPEDVVIQNRSFRIVGTQRELAQDGLYFCPAAKRVINTVANGMGLGSWKGRYIIVANPDVGMGLKGGDDGSIVHQNVSIRFNEGFMPTNDMIVEGVKYYERALNPSGNGIEAQIYQHPMDFSEITLTRPTAFDVVIVHFLCKN